MPLLMAKAVEVVKLPGPEPATVLALAPASVMPRPMMAVPSLRPAATLMAVDPVKAAAFGKATTSTRLATELEVHPVQATVTQVTRTPMVLQVPMEPVAAAAPVEATAMVAVPVVELGSAKVKGITMETMARAMRTVVAMEVEVEVVMTVGSAAVPVVDQGTAMVLFPVTMMVAAMVQHLEIHLVEIISSMGLGQCIMLVLCSVNLNVFFF